MLPFFLQAPSGRLLVVLHGAPDDTITSTCVLHLPAFAEEMNKSRAMVALAAREFAANGYSVLVPDLYGTGDSEGEFGEASWNLWLQDVVFLLEWLVENGAKRIVLWGLRLGALMALQTASLRPDHIQRLLLWQPQYSGQLALNQFLRLRMAATMMLGERESVSTLREQLSAGTSLEVAGYEVSPSLFTELEEVNATRLSIPDSIAISLTEVVSNAERGLSQLGTKQVEQWRENGITCDTATVIGAQFWSTQEISNALELVPQALDALGVVSTEEPPAATLPSTSHMKGERGLRFECGGATLAAVLHPVATPACCGVVLVVGGPQYRVGSHRQFVLVARRLAEAGIPVLRFDYRGMGDSDGAQRDFLSVRDDIRAAVDQLTLQCPGLKRIVLWGLCDAATACSFYAATDDRINGLVLLNPWVRSEAGEAKTYLKHYYGARLMDADMWKKVLRGEFKFLGSLKSLWLTIKTAYVQRGSTSPQQVQGSTDLALRLEQSLAAFPGQVLLICSGNDLTAAEFLDVVDNKASFRQLLEQKRFRRRLLEGADHTFSSAEWRAQVEGWTTDWVENI